MEAGNIAALSGAVRTSLSNEARIIGIDGYIRVPDFLAGISPGTT